jgi:hypothetical protein
MNWTLLALFLVAAPYQSRRGDWLVSLQIPALRGHECEHGDEEDDDPLPHTFAVDAAGKVTFLGTAMTLVDAGDYDADGRSELIFWRTVGDNSEGYILVADHFATRVEFSWFFH